MEDDLISDIMRKYEGLNEKNKRAFLTYLDQIDSQE